MDERTQISTADLHRILCREFSHLRASACTACEPPMPRRNGDGSGWTYHFRKCDLGCHSWIEWMVEQYAKQYRPRDFCDTVS
jgi:hypothetical protein